MEFKIVYARSSAELQKAVSEYLGHGWRIMSSPCAVDTRLETRLVVPHFIYWCQTLLRQKSPIGQAS
jgi:hypothetical protein